MQQFMVPQFIDVEDKIIGPITVRQFVLILAGVLIGFLFFKLFTFWVFVVLAFIDLAIFGILSFARVNGRPVHFFLLNFLQTSRRPWLRIWNKEFYVRDIRETKIKVAEQGRVVRAQRPKVTRSRLNELSLVINTGGVYQGDAPSPKIEKQ